MVAIRVEGKTVRGDVALAVAPGTKAAKRDRALDKLLAAPLAEAAEALGVVLAAAPHTYAFPQPGNDDQGHTRFLVRGRIEGDRLVPERVVRDGDTNDNARSGSRGSNSGSSNNK